MRKRTTIREAIDGAANLCRAVLRDGAGSAVFYTALIVPMLLGGVGLATDVGLWYVTKRTAQAAADAAAMAATFEVVRGSSPAAVEQAAMADAVLNGLDPGAGDDLDVNNPPESGPQTGVTTAVEAVVQRTSSTFFSHVLLGGPVTITARAVAMVVRPESCVWVLEKTEVALEVSGGANVDLDCGVYAQSSNSAAVNESGSGCLRSTSIVVAGGTSGDCLHPEPRGDAAQIGDPLAHLEAPTYPVCVENGKVKVTGGAVTLNPCVYRGGIDITGGTVTFNPGVYVLEGGTLKATGGSTLIGSGVTFYLTNSGGNHASLQINAADMDLSAPTTGPLKGILFFQDRDAPTTLTNDVSGNAGMKLEGILYFPTTNLDFSGGAEANNTSTMIVARKVRFTGNSYLESENSLSIFPSGLIPAALVE